MNHFGYHFISSTILCYLILLAGTPATTAWTSMSFTTTAFAPITAPDPI
jgi:hypothetical protein